MIITISGLPGSGKSTVGKMLAKKLGYNFYSIGDLRGKMAMDKGMTIDELNKLGQEEDWTDRQADEYQTELAKKEDNFVIDSRLSWHFIPKSLKIFLTVNLKEAAQRIFRDQRPDEQHANSVEELIERMKKRVISDNTRYQKWYGVRFDDENRYDLTIDTTNLKPEEVVEKILKEVTGNP